jgi:hypothetical protein
MLNPEHNETRTTAAGDLETLADQDIDFLTT